MKINWQKGFWHQQMFYALSYFLHPEIILINDFICSSYYLSDDWLRDWFFTPRENEMPLILRITAYNDDLIHSFIGQLKKVKKLDKGDED
jgi:hypothetical protein